MTPRAAAALTAWFSVLLASTVTASPAAASATNIPNPCRLLTTQTIVGALHPAHRHPVISHTTYSAGTPNEDKLCTWKFGALEVVVSAYNVKGGSGGPPTKTTPEPSLGPNGELTQSTSPQYKFTIVSYKRHSHYVDIHVNRNVKPPPMMRLGKFAYKRT